MSRVTSTSAVAAWRARRTASSRRTSWVPAWMIRGGRPDRSANTGLMRPRAGSCPGGVVGDAGLEGFPAEQRVDVALGFHGGPGQGEVGVRGHDEGRGGQRQPVIAGVDQGGDGEAAAGGLAREGDVRGGGAAVQEGLVGGESVVDRGRIRVLGGEPVVDGDDLGAGPPADLRGQAGGLEGVPQHVHAAVEVQDNVAGFDSVDGDLGGRDAAQCGCGHGQVGGQRLRRCQLAEQPPLLVDVDVGGEG